MPRVLPGIEPDQIKRRAGHSDIGTPAIRIPTDDPEAALQFCRRLAGLMDLDDAVEIAPIGNARAAVHTPDAEQPSPDLSVVMPVFNEQANLLVLYERLSSVLKQ